MVQEAHGWVSPEAITEVAQLDLTAAYVKGVVSFYTMYHQHPVGRHFIQVCTTSPCNICGAEDVVDAFLEHTGCGDLGATSPDGRFTVAEVECLGACGFATPVLILIKRDDFIESVTPEPRSRHSSRSPAPVLPDGLSASDPPEGNAGAVDATSATPRRARYAGWVETRRVRGPEAGARHDARADRG
jgi:NADH:ubiquinone oxidoreductase subunit E